MRWRPRRRGTQPDLTPRVRTETVEIDLPPQPGVEATASEPAEPVRPLEIPSFAPVPTVVDRRFPEELVTTRTILEQRPSLLEHRARSADAPRGEVRVRAARRRATASEGPRPQATAGTPPTPRRLVVTLPAPSRRRRAPAWGRTDLQPSPGVTEDLVSRLGRVEAGQLDPFFFATLAQHGGDRPPTPRATPPNAEASRRSAAPPSRGTAAPAGLGLPPRSPRPPAPTAVARPPAAPAGPAPTTRAPLPAGLQQSTPTDQPSPPAPTASASSTPLHRHRSDDTAADAPAPPPPARMIPGNRPERPVVQPRPAVPPPAGVQPVVARPLGTIAPIRRAPSGSSAPVEQREETSERRAQATLGPEEATAASAPADPSPARTTGPSGPGSPPERRAPDPAGARLEAAPSAPAPIHPSPESRPAPERGEDTGAQPRSPAPPAPGAGRRPSAPEASAAAAPPSAATPPAAPRSDAATTPPSQTPAERQGSEDPPRRRPGLGAPLTGPVPPTAHRLIGPAEPPEVPPGAPMATARPVPESPADPSREPPAGGPEPRPMVWTPSGFVEPETVIDADPSPATDPTPRVAGSVQVRGSTGPLQPGTPSPESAWADAVAQRVERWTGVRLPPVTLDRSASAAERADALRAAAFTDDAGVHLPPAIGPLETPSARALLAHELTHVAQRQRLGSAPVPGESSPLGARMEAEARAAEQRERAAARVEPPFLRRSQPGPGRTFTVLGDGGGAAGLLASSPAPEPPVPALRIGDAGPAVLVAPSAAGPAPERVPSPSERRASAPAGGAGTGVLPAYPAPSPTRSARVTGPTAAPATSVPPVLGARRSAPPTQQAWTTPPPPRQPASPSSPQPPPAPGPSPSGERTPQRAALAPATAELRSPWDEPPSAKQLDQLARRLLPTLTAAIRAELAADRDRIGALTNNYQRW